MRRARYSGTRLHHDFFLFIICSHLFDIFHVWNHVSIFSLTPLSTGTCFLINEAGRKLSASPLFQNMRTRTFGICLHHSPPSASPILMAKSKTVAAVSSLMK
nr:MAG TPA: hypothetical protein [Caudoviricetes sp.]